MAKSARASSNKVNNQKLKKNVFGPVETARLARLSAKIAEISALPKAPRPVAKAEKVADEGVFFFLSDLSAHRLWL
ncbi:hypothetical protein B0T22DRAFT_447645 [Podospora appendiculata]|uniref:DUF2423 domain-containing protein n=1 Tax=Podospora appendiculata TaxID=314037 RepID=A0AAE1CFF8_9PEZI|nr:hypothetical protein B0T22DRAFT_447645 [Podospora appendiculata]